MSDTPSAEFRVAVQAREIDFSTYHLPDLDNLDCDEVVEMIRQAETTASPDLKRDGYRNGTADYNDQLAVILGTGPVLLTADHATDRIHHYDDERGSRQYKADPGTFGLSYVSRAKTNNSLIAPIGRQTGDANYDLEHPLKAAMKPIIADPATAAHLSIHRMFRGHVPDPYAPRAFNVMLGIGNRASDATKDFADKAIEAARTYDLNVDVNRPTVEFESDRHTPKRNSDGSVEYITFAAKGPGTTRSYSQGVAEACSKPLIAAQIEFSASILLQPVDHPDNPGPKSQRVGVYLGYLFLQECIAAASVAF